MLWKNCQLEIWGEPLYGGGGVHPRSQHFYQLSQCFLLTLMFLRIWIGKFVTFQLCQNQRILLVAVESGSHSWEAETLSHWGWHGNFSGNCSWSLIMLAVDSNVIWLKFWNIASWIQAIWKGGIWYVLSAPWALLGLTTSAWLSPGVNCSWGMIQANPWAQK